ncbi:MAG TPA: hypothetical protein VMU69_17680, partial [Bradyrhizobium sp.]|nr:hypothetical protein [Bradyrhizobium sp.]
MISKQRPASERDAMERVWSHPGAGVAITLLIPAERARVSDVPVRAFSSEVDTGSGEENASRQKGWEPGSDSIRAG